MESYGAQKTPYGVGGWLAFYVWTNLIILPMFIVIMLTYPQYVKDLKPEAAMLLPKDIPFYERLCLSFIAFLEEIACFMLLNKSPRAVWLAKQALLAQMGYLVARFLILIDEKPAASGFLDALGQLWQAVFVPLAWYLYFSRSRRVKNTFPDA